MKPPKGFYRFTRYEHGKQDIIEYPTSKSGMENLLEIVDVAISAKLDFAVHYIVEIPKQILIQGGRK